MNVSIVCMRVVLTMLTCADKIIQCCMCDYIAKLQPVNCARSVFIAFNVSAILLI